MSIKILFLDIDGVLNCKKSGTFYDIDHPERYSIDEDLWKNLQIFLNVYPDLKVVIHSGWIKHKDNPNYAWDLGSPEKNVKINTLLPTVISRLGDRYLDCVPYLQGKSKKTRIQTWLYINDVLGKSDCPCLVLDDDRSEYADLLSLEEYGNVYVHFTETEFGLNGMALMHILEIGDLIFR